MFDMYTAADLVCVALLGLFAGVQGGMLGVGGSVIMIPGLVVILGRPTGAEQHLYQAAAMIANIAVSVPAAMRHRKAGAMTPQALRWMLPAALVCVLLGVALSNLSIFSGRQGGIWLGRALAVFLLYVIYVNVMKLARPKPIAAAPASTSAPEAAGASAADADGTLAYATPGRGLTIGVTMGTFAGLLGIGGGGIAVPMQQTLMKLPLRNCIANSSAVICVSAALGAFFKNYTLGQHSPPGMTMDWHQSLALGLMLAPTAWIGGRLGASLTHKLPLRYIRVFFIAIMCIAAWKLAAL